MFLQEVVAVSFLAVFSVAAEPPYLFSIDILARFCLETKGFWYRGQASMPSSASFSVHIYGPLFLLLFAWAFFPFYCR